MFCFRVLCDIFMEGFWDAFSSLLLGVFCDVIIRGFTNFLLGDYMKNQGGILVVALFSGCVRMFKGKGRSSYERWI